jgi:CRP/FNR family cyclic AMP-dependent transcriptional regulator
VRTIAEYMPQHPFFQGLDDSMITMFAGCAHNVHFRPGEYLFHEGEPADAFFVVRHGRVSLEVRAAAGPALVVDTVHDDDVLGWSWLVPPFRWTFDARATDQTSATAFDGGCLREKAMADPVVGFALLQRVVTVMSERVQSARVRLLDLYGEPA